MKSKILLIADSPDWAFARTCNAIEKRLNHKYDFTKAHFNKKIDKTENGFQNIFKMDLQQFNLIMIPGILYFPTGLLKDIDPARIVIGVSSHHHFDDAKMNEKFIRLMSLSNNVYGVSEYLYKKLEETFRNTNHNIYYRPSGVDIEQFNNSTQRKNNIFTIGWVGNAAHWGPMDHKRFYSMIVPIVRHFANNKQYHFLLAIKTLNRDIRQEFKKYNNVGIKTIAPENMPNYYNNLDMVLVASKSESICFPMTESICCGRPVITTDVGYARSLILNGVNGQIVNPDISEFIKHIEKFREKSYNEVYKLNRFIAENILSWDILISYTDLMFTAILKQKRKGD